MNEVLSFLAGVVVTFVIVAIYLAFIKPARTTVILEYQCSTRTVIVEGYSDLVRKAWAKVHASGTIGDPPDFPEGDAVPKDVAAGSSETSIQGPGSWPSSGPYTVWCWVAAPLSPTKITGNCPMGPGPGPTP
jgi:hypothetical protein